MNLFSAAVLALSLTSPDPASGDTVTDTATVGETVQQRTATSASSSADKSVSASCPSGTKVVGASGAVNGERTAVTKVKPSADLTSVEVTAVEHSGGTTQTWTVTARAKCAPGTFTLVTKGGTNTAEAFCPTGTKVLGIGGEGLHLTKLAPQTQLTGATVAGPGDVTAHAICGSGHPGLVLRSGGTSVMTTKSGSSSVDCQGSEKVISAGGSVTGATLDDVVPQSGTATLSGQAKEAQGQAIRWSITPYAVCST